MPQQMCVTKLRIGSQEGVSCAVFSAHGCPEEGYSACSDYVLSDWVNVTTRLPEEQRASSWDYLLDGRTATEFSVGVLSRFRNSVVCSILRCWCNLL